MEVTLRPISAHIAVPTCSAVGRRTIGRDSPTGQKGHSIDQRSSTGVSVIIIRGYGQGIDP
ncbi:hypothetical protein GCM10025331_70950 [Actinoplanes utahensis]|nr:hypothetical protein Aut01nite_74670 [Actinoplanes utahensis]